MRCLFGIDDGYWRDCLLLIMPPDMGTLVKSCSVFGRSSQQCSPSIDIAVFQEISTIS